MHSRRRKHTHRITRSRPGIAPGTLVADPTAPKSTVRVLAYSADQCVEQPLVDPGELPALLARWPVVWINVEGLGDADLIARLGALLKLHNLALEDVLNTHQRAEVEQYDSHLFMVTQMLAVGPPLQIEQVSLFVGRGFVVTFQEGHPGDCFEPVRQRIRGAAGRHRHAGADYLAYSLLDAVIDGYFPVLEALGERLELLEDEILLRADRRTVSAVHDAKRDLVALRRIVWPLREALNTLIRDESPLVSPETRVYLRDCYDHAVRIIDFIETYRELGADLTDLYLSSVSQRMNEVMKVLTIIATIFIPLTFIAGIYGMNFNTEASPWNMPELNWLWGYPFALLLMALIAGGLLSWFWRKGWLHGDPPAGPGPS